ncbi:MAG: high light inducible protein [Cyanobium sp. CZS 25K]|nr:high light inducible protein [Cyanobium sp. CZS25K]
MHLDRPYSRSGGGQIHTERLQTVVRFHGRAALLGFVTGVLSEALTGQGILHQIGLGTLLSQG